MKGKIPSRGGSAGRGVRRAASAAPRGFTYKYDLRRRAFDYASPEAAEILGFPVGKMLGMSFDKVVARLHPQDRKRMGGFIELLAGGKLEENMIPVMEYRWKCADGRYRWFSDTRRIIRDDKGNPASVLATVKEITPRKMRESAILTQNEWLGALFRNTFDGISICTFDHITGRRELVLCNDRYVEMSGYTRRQLMACDNLNALGKSLQHELDTKGRLTRGVPCQGISIWKRPDGKENYYEWTASPLYVEGKLYLVGVDRDITERRKTENAFARNRQWLQLIMRNSNDGINVCRLDPRTETRTLVFCNTRYVEMSGHGREELLACKNLNKLCREVQIDPNFVQLMLKGRSCKGVSSWIRPDGRENYYEYTATPLFIDGQLHVVGVDRDITDKKRMEDALAKNQRWLDLIMRHSQDGINICRKDERTGRRTLVFCNERYVEMSGRTLKELMAAKDLNELVKGIRVPKGVRKLLRKGIPYSGESSWRRPDGKENYYEWTAVPIRIDGKLHIVGVDRDITERKRAEDALARNQRWLDLIMRHSQDGINIYKIFPGLKGRKLVFCNDQFVKMSGRTRNELMETTELKKLIRDIRLPANSAECWRRNKSFSGEASRIRPDGKENYYEWTAAPFQLDGELYTVGIDRDITERHRAENALHAILNASNDSAFLMDIHGKLLAHNQRLAVRVGCGKDDSLVGTNVYSFFDRDTARRRKARVDEAVAAGKPALFEDSYRGQRVEHSINPVLDGNGKVMAVAVHVRDITGYRNLEAQVLRIAESERERIGQDLHDGLGQTLTGLAYSCEALRQGLKAKMPKESRRAGEIARQAGELVGLARSLARGLSPVGNQPESLTIGLSELASTTRKVFAIACTFRCTRPASVGDGMRAAHLFRIAQEAVNNAVRHARASKIEISLSARGNETILTVCDDGRGPAKKIRNGGMGINIMRYRAGIMGGRLEINHRPGVGTVVICAVPTREP